MAEIIRSLGWVLVLVFQIFITGQQTRLARNDKKLAGNDKAIMDNLVTMRDQDNRILAAFGAAPLPDMERPKLWEG